MTYEIITQEDLQKFRLQLLEDLTRILSGAVQPQSSKEWLRSSEVRKMLGISHWYATEFTHQEYSAAPKDWWLDVLQVPGYSKAVGR
jgi:hypothetical protein